MRRTRGARNGNFENVIGQSRNRGGADAQRAAGGAGDGGVDSATVDIGPVGTVEIGGDQFGATNFEAQMTSGNGRIPDGHVALVTPEHERSAHGVLGGPARAADPDEKSGIFVRIFTHRAAPL